MNQPRRAAARNCPPQPGQAGFSLLEVVITLFIMAVVLVAMLALFDSAAKVARAESHLAELQQSVRIGHNEMVKTIRMTARGWVVGGAAAWAAANQVQVRDNVTAGEYIGSVTTPEYQVREHTDVLRVRGVINGSLYQPEIPEGALPVPELRILEHGEVGPAGTKQDIESLRKIKDTPLTNAFRLLVINRLGDIAVVNAEVDTATATEATITYAVLTPDELLARPKEAWINDAKHAPIVMAGIVEEYAFYVRDNAGRPRLSLARFQPDSDPPNQPYGNNPDNLKLDIADDILDLQVAVGVDMRTDTTGDGVINENDSTDGVLTETGADDDEWFFNNVDDEPLPVLSTEGNLFYIRISTLGRTEGRDFQYVSPRIDRIEDHDYSFEQVQPDSPEQVVERSHRRRLLRTVIDLRNM